MATPTALPTSFVSGQILTAADQNLLRGAFRVLQVVSGTTSVAAQSSSTTYADTGLTATITPLYNTSKILVIATQNGCGKEAGNLSSELDVGLFRGATQLNFGTGGSTGTSAVNYFGSITLMALDSPATTSATIYKTQFRNYVAAASVRVQTGNTLLSTSTIILAEISA